MQKNYDVVRARLKTSIQTIVDNTSPARWDNTASETWRNGMRTSLYTTAGNTSSERWDNTRSETWRNGMWATRVQRGETTPGVRHEEMGCGQRKFSKVRQHQEWDMKKWDADNASSARWDNTASETWRNGIKTSLHTTEVQRGETTLGVRREEMG